MTIAFQIRTTKSAKSEEEVPVYIRLVDGREWLFRNRTQILVRPDFWDPKNEGIKKRVVCSNEDRQKVDDEIEKLRTYVRKAYTEDHDRGKIKKGWLEKTLQDYYAGKERGPKRRKKNEASLEKLFDKFLEGRDPQISRTKHYHVLKRTLLRYEEYVRLSQPRQSKYVLDVKAVTTEDLNDIYDYIVNEHQIVKDYPGILEAYPETRKIQERGGNTVTGIIKKLRAFFNWCEKEGFLKKNPFIGFEKGGR